MKHKYTKDSIYDLRMREERKKLRKVGVIVGMIIAVVIIFAAKDLEFVKRIPLAPWHRTRMDISQYIHLSGTLSPENHMCHKDFLSGFTAYLILDSNRYLLA